MRRGACARRGLAHAPGRRRARGFTFPELIATMVVAVILAGVGIPSFAYVTSSNRVSAELNGLLGDLMYARSEAIREGRPVTVCASSNGTSCSGQPAWDQGWIVFMDANGNQVVDPGESILRTQPTFTSGDTFQASNGLAAITFNREGFAFGVPGVATLVLHAQHNNNNWTKCLQITTVGQAQTELAGQGNCS
jgi:type IV fimbrial biogenesis protein FimT